MPIRFTHIYAANPWPQRFCLRSRSSISRRPFARWMVTTTWIKNKDLYAQYFVNTSICSYGIWCSEGNPCWGTRILWSGNQFILARTGYRNEVRGSEFLDCPVIDLVFQLSETNNDRNTPARSIYLFLATFRFNWIPTNKKEPFAPNYRLSLLRSFILGFSDKMLKNHDALDPACLELVAGLHWLEIYDCFWWNKRWWLNVDARHNKRNNLYLSFSNFRSQSQSSYKMEALGSSIAGEIEYRCHSNYNKIPPESRYHE